MRRKHKLGSHYEDNIFFDIKRRVNVDPDKVILDQFSSGSSDYKDVLGVTRLDRTNDPNERYPLDDNAVIMLQAHGVPQRISSSTRTGRLTTLEKIDESCGHFCQLFVFTSVALVLSLVLLGVIFFACLAFHNNVVKPILKHSGSSFSSLTDILLRREHARTELKEKLQRENNREMTDEQHLVLHLKARPPSRHSTVNV
jgi:hypothetical protein